MRPFFRWLRRLPLRPFRHAPAQAQRSPKPFRPMLEALETRVVPDSGGAAAVYAGAHLAYGGGPLIANIQVEPIFLQDAVSGNQTSAANRAQFDAFFNAITSDGYIANQLYQYSAGGYTIGNGTVGADDTSARVAPNGTVGADPAYQDSLIQTTIANEIAAGNTAAPNANTVYFVFTPPGDAVINNGDNSERNFEGYHSSFTSGGQTIYYVVIPDQISTPHNLNASAHGFNGMQGMTQTASHEMAEAITDPNCETGWSEAGPTFVGLDGGEIGDHGGNSANIMDGFSVQALWSNALTDLAHPPSTGANDLFINQIAAPAVDTWTGGPIATFTDLNTSLTASNFYADVSDDNGAWTNVTITGSDGHFVVSADPPAPLADGEVGHPFEGDGLQVIVSTSPISFTNPSGAPTALKATPYVVSTSAPLTYIADSGSGPNNFVLKVVGNNFQLSDNGLVVFTQPIAATTGIIMSAAPVVPGNASQDVDNSLTVDYSGGVFANPITFDGGPGLGAHTITFVGGAFASESYTPTSATGGSMVLGNQTVRFTNVETAVNLTAAANFAISGANANDQLTLSNGPTLGGVSTMQIICISGAMGAVDFANQAAVTVREFSGADTFTLKSSHDAAGLGTLNLDGGVTPGVLYQIQQTPSGLTTNVLGGGSAVTVDVGYAGSLQRILGPVNIDNASGAFNTITVDDSADAVSQTATLSATTLDGLAPADISFTAGGTQSLTINGGSGGNRCIVNSAGLFPTILNAGSGADVVTVNPLGIGTNLTVNGQLPSVAPGDTLYYTAAGIANPSGPGAGTITEAGQATVTYTGIEDVRFDPSEAVNAIWVNTDEITDPGARQNFINQCVINGINTVYLSVYQPTPNSDGLLMYDETDMAALISSAHAHGIQVWADYGAPDWPSLGAAPGSFPMQRLADVVAYDAANPTAAFDGVMLDVEYVYDPSNPAPNDTQEHTFLQELVPLYQAALNELVPAGLEVGAAISAFWNPNELTNQADQAAVTITVGSTTAPAYQQIIGLGLDQVVVLGYRDFAGNIPASEGEDGIVGLDQDEINYAASSGSPSLIVAGLETQNILPSDQTFYSDGNLAMDGVMQTVAGYFGSNLAGFAIDGYGDVYLSGQPNWPASSQITPTINWPNPADITYGTLLSGTQLDATASTAGTFTYTLADGTTPASGAVLSAGASQTLEVTFTPSNSVDFTPATDSVVINVLKATPSVFWGNPVGITYGTALGSTQLDATSNIPGTFSYTLADGVTPANGAVLNAGPSQTLNVVFTPTDSIDYNTTSDSALINVAKATPTITWNHPADIPYGTALNSTQLSATANVLGIFTYTLADGVTPAFGAILNAGIGQTLLVSFAPADEADYTSAYNSVLINVLKATPSLTWSNPGSITYGATLGAAQLDASANTPGAFTYTLADGVTPALGALLSAGFGQTLNVSFAPTDTLDFTQATGSAAINVLTATPTFSGLSAPTINYGTASTVLSGHLNANANGQPVPTHENVQITINGVTQNARLDASDNFTTTFNTATLGSTVYDIDYRYVGDANFASAESDSSMLTVNPAPQTIIFNPPSSTVYGSTPLTLSATGGASGNPVTFTLISGPATLAGNLLTVTGIGNVVVEADQTGSANYAAASPVQQTIAAAPTFQASLSQYENGTPAVMKISTLLGTHYHDPDGTTYTKPGIAVFQTSGVGTWQYSVNGTTWLSIGSVSRTQALLLPAADWVRFLPTTNTSGQASLVFVAWDGSAGKAGTLANTQPGGGTTAFSLTAGALNVTVNPVVTWVGAGAALTPILPGTYTSSNAATPAGNTIASVFGSYFQDVNPSVAVAVAVSGVTGNGAWEYSTNGGATWFTFAPAPSLTNAYLLTESDLIRFVPAISVATVGTLTAYAWDDSGVHPATVNLTQTGVGAATGFSATPLTATAAANHGPIVSTPAITGTAVPTNAAGAAITVSSLLTQAGYSDTDGQGIPKGIAITGTASSAGTFQYLLSGGAWQALPSVSPSAALLLPSTASLRLVAGASTGSASVTFVGWDQSAGVAGLTANASVGGGANPFSTASSTLSIAVKQAAPAWSASSGALLTPILPGSYSTANATTPAGNTVASVFGSYFLEGDSNRPVGIAISVVTGAGTWQYSRNAGATWTNFPALSNTNALLLSANDTIRFVPRTTAPSTATLVAYAWDGTVGADGGTINLVTSGTGGASPFSATTLTAACAVNTAPKLTTANVTLAAINSNVTSPAITATALLKAAGYSDADRGAYSGIAITSDLSLTPGVWQWLNGAIWTALPNVSLGAAFLLPNTAQVRFQPAASTNTNGRATLTYLAWDQTAGAADHVYPIASQGGANAFSQQAATASMTVNFVRQSPSWAAGVSAAFTPVLGYSASNSSPSPAGDSVSAVFGSAFVGLPTASVGIAITGLNSLSAGVWQYSTNNGATWTNVPAVSMTNALLLPSSAKLRFVPNKLFSGIVTLTAYAWDGTGNFGATANLALTGLGGASPFSATALAATCLVNTAPTLTS